MIDKPDTGGSVVQPEGQPISDAYTGIVGTDGGLVKSPDGRIEIDIPAGALTEDTEIGIQPLQNTSVSGVGYSYRLTPHGKNFKKKITVRFHYKNDERRLSSKQALEIAYQNENGEWICTGGTVNSMANKTVAVQTDHFSDWALIESMNLTPVVKTIGLNETLTLKAWRYVYPDNGDEFLIPLAIPNAKIGLPGKMDQQFIVKWTLNGPGKLEAKGAEAVYTAPSSKPANKTATVTLELNVHGKQVLLISTIHLITEGIEISIDGGPWKTYAGMATKMPGLNKYSMANLRLSADLPQIVLMWPMNTARANGIYSWTMLAEEENSVVFQYAEPDLQHMYVAIYDDGVDTRDSGGFLSVEEITEGGKKYLAGVFAVDQAGYLDNSDGSQQKISGIMGTYKVPRNW